MENCPYTTKNANQQFPNQLSMSNLLEEPSYECIFSNFELNNCYVFGIDNKTGVSFRVDNLCKLMQPIIFAIAASLLVMDQGLQSHRK